MHARPALPSSKSARPIVCCFVIVVAATLSFARSAAAQGDANSWQFDPGHSSAQFTVRHMMISNVNGVFNKMSGTVQYDPADVTKSSVEVTIDAASIDTRNEGRDKDLRSANFFDVDKFPTLTFRSKRVEPAGQGKLKLTGDLTIHGVTKEVAFDVTGPSQAIKDPRGNLHAGASATTKINRRDFGLNYNNMVANSSPMVGDEITINIDIEMIHRAAAPGSN